MVWESDIYFLNVSKDGWPVLERLTDNTTDISLWVKSELYDLAFVWKYRLKNRNSMLVR